MNESISSLSESIVSESAGNLGFENETSEDSNSGHFPSPDEFEGILDEDLIYSWTADDNNFVSTHGSTFNRNVLKFAKFVYGLPAEKRTGPSLCKYIRDHYCESHANHSEAVQVLSTSEGRKLMMIYRFLITAS